MVYRMRASPGMTTISLTKAFDEGPALGQLALLQEVFHVPGVGRNGLHVVQVLYASQASWPAWMLGDGASAYG